MKRKKEGVQTKKCHRHSIYGKQQMPDQALQVEMLQGSRMSPGTIVHLSGEGAGYFERKSFQVTLEIVWSGVEVLA